MVNILPPRRPAMRVNSMPARHVHAPYPAANAPAPGVPLPRSEWAERLEQTEGIEPPEPGRSNGFLASHFGNPEKNEVYGVGNDYESEEGQIADEKASAGQAIWYLGALVLLLSLGVWLFGYR